MLGYCSIRTRMTLEMDAVKMLDIEDDKLTNTFLLFPPVSPYRDSQDLPHHLCSLGLSTVMIKSYKCYSESY